MEMNPLPPGNYDLKPLWASSPKKFIGVHEVIIAIRFQEWENEGREHSLVKFTAAYLVKLPTDLPAGPIIDIVQLIGTVWQKRYADRTELVAGAVMA